MKIFVGNMNFQTGEESLRSLFAQHGDVDEVAVIMDRETGRPRGFAFVTMPNDDEGQAAIDALDGQDFEGRRLNVNVARERSDRGDRGGRGGGGGGGGGRQRW